VTEYDATATRRRRAARRADPAAAQAAVSPAPPAPAPAPPVPPTGFRLAASSEGLAGTALVGQAVLYRRWPVDGWARGTVAQAARSRRGCRVFARGANIRVRPRVGGGAAATLAAARRGLAWPGRPMGAPPSRCALVSLASLY
jgi:hypothetical protein